MADIKLKNGDGIEITYTGVNTMAMRDANSEGHIMFVNADDDTAIAADLLVGKTAHTSTGPIIGTIVSWIGEKTTNMLTSTRAIPKTTTDIPVAETTTRAVPKTASTVPVSTNPAYIRPRAVKKYI